MHEWLQIKRYPHIGLPIEEKDRKKIAFYITNSNNIAKHSFTPLIRRTIKTTRCSIDKTNNHKTFNQKIRNLTYASHIDSAIFSYYGYILQQKYEQYLLEHHIENIPTAYRKIKCNPLHPEYGNKCNIEIAKEVFDYIKKEKNSHHNIAIITFDIKGFFDNLDHKKLKQLWKKILGLREEMPKDIYQVFKHTTNFSYIHEEQLFKLFKDEIICKKNDGTIIKKSVKNHIYMRERKAIAFCERKDIKKIRDAHIIRTNPSSSRGIPQGLPISATLANVYMCEFDEIINNEIITHNGLYRRYSDDIIIVCPIEQANHIKQYVTEEIKKIKLEIEVNKTNIYTLDSSNNWSIIIPDINNKKKELEYLGFSFDGSRTLIKKAGIEKHYRKMRKAQKRSLWYAIRIQNETAGCIFENQLLKRFSLIGAKRHKIRLRDKYNHSKFKVCKNKQKSFGNFFTYVHKAAAVMSEDCIKRQLRRNLHKLKEGNANIKREVIKHIKHRRP